MIDNEEFRYLLSQAKTSQAAEAKTFRLLYTLAYSVAKKVCQNNPNIIDDVVQESMISLSRAIKLDEIDNINYFVATVVKNKAKDMMRDIALDREMDQVCYEKYQLKTNEPEVKVDCGNKIVQFLAETNATQREAAKILKKSLRDINNAKKQLTMVTKQPSQASYNIER